MVIISEISKQQIIMDSDRNEPISDGQQCSMMECFPAGGSSSNGDDNVDHEFYGDAESLSLGTASDNGSDGSSSSNSSMNEANLLQEKIASTMDDNVLWFKQPDLFNQNQDGENPISREDMKWLLETRLAYVNLMLAALDCVDERKKQKSSDNVASRKKFKNNRKKFKTHRQKYRTKRS